jgi:hypothetical protein
MTIIELFPWLLAVCVAFSSAPYLKQLGVSGGLATIGGLVLGIISWLMCVFGGRFLVGWIDRSKSGKKSKIDERNKLS